MSSRTAELVRELRRLDPHSRVLNLFPEHVTHEDRTRGAFERLTRAIGAHLQRGERAEADEALRRYVTRGECDE